MGEIKYPLEEQDYPDVKGKCHICSDHASDAYWMGNGITFEVCRYCAVEKLPLMIADAVGLNGVNDIEKIQHTERAMKAAFWRGLALRLLREKATLQRKPKKHRASKVEREETIDNDV